MNNLKLINAKKFILISTCEVYGNHAQCNEKTRIIKSKLSNYGLNRFYLEEFVKRKFLDHHIIRLPIGYSKLVKIFIYLINKNLAILMEMIVQIYDVKIKKRY